MAAARVLNSEIRVRAAREPWFQMRGLGSGIHPPRDRPRRHAKAWSSARPRSPSGALQTIPNEHSTRSKVRRPRRVEEKNRPGENFLLETADLRCLSPVRTVKITALALATDGVPAQAISASLFFGAYLSSATAPWWWVGQVTRKRSSSVSSGAQPRFRAIRFVLLALKVFAAATGAPSLARAIACVCAVV